MQSILQHHKPAGAGLTASMGSAKNNLFSIQLEIDLQTESPGIGKDFQVNYVCTLPLSKTLLPFALAKEDPPAFLSRQPEAHLFLLKPMPHLCFYIVFKLLFDYGYFIWGQCSVNC